MASVDTEEGKGDTKIEKSTASKFIHKIAVCRNQIFTTFIVTIGSFGTGTVFGWSAVATDNILNRNDFGTLSKDNEISWVTSLAILGAFLAGPLAGYLMDKVGRKTSIIIFTFPFIIGWMTMCSAFFVRPNGFFLLYIGRILTGVCAGSYLVILPTYIKETCTDSMRGTLGSAMALMLVTGMLYTFIIGTFFNWVIISACCGVIPVLLLIGSFFIPETPRYLLVNKREDEAIAVFQWLNRIDSTEIAKFEFELVCATLSDTGLKGQAGNCRWRQLTTRPVALPIILILCVVFFQQFGGINAVTMYTVDIFRGAGDYIKPHTATIVMGVVQVMFVTLSMILIDLLGRKILLVGCSLIMSLNLAGLGYYFFLKEKGDGSELAYGWLPIFTILLYIAAYSCGVGSVVWVLGSEIYHPDYRAGSSTIMTSAYWIFGFIVAQTFENLKEAINESGCFWFYGASSLAGAIFALLFIPETKGKSSDEIVKCFSNNVPYSVSKHDLENGTVPEMSPLAGSEILQTGSASDTSINEDDLGNNFDEI